MANRFYQTFLLLLACLFCAPLQAQETLNCSGNFACESSTQQFSGGQDQVMICDGQQACDSATINFVVGDNHTLNCSEFRACRDTVVNSSLVSNTTLTLDCQDEESCRGLDIQANIDPPPAIVDITCNREKSCQDLTVNGDLRGTTINIACDYNSSCLNATIGGTHDNNTTINCSGGECGDLIIALFIDTDADGLPDDENSCDLACGGGPYDFDDDGDGVIDTVDTAPLDSSNSSEVTLQLNEAYSGAVLNRQQGPGEAPILINYPYSPNQTGYVPLSGTSECGYNLDTFPSATFPYSHAAWVGNNFFNSGISCGSVIEVNVASATSPAPGCTVTGTTVKAVVVGTVPADPNYIDLSQVAFQSIVNDAPTCGTLQNIPFRFVPGEYTGNIQLINGSGVSQWWYRLFAEDHNIAISKMEIQSNGSGSWIEGVYQFNNGGGFVFSTGVPYSLPLSVRLTSTSGEVITMNNVITTFNSQDQFDGGDQFIGTAADPITGQ